MHCKYCSDFSIQVDLDEKASVKITDENGDISKEDFVKIAQDSKLLDFGNAMGGDGNKQQSVKKQQRTYNNNAGAGLQGGKVGIAFMHFESQHELAFWNELTSDFGF